MELWRSLLYRSLDLERDIVGHPEYLLEAHRSGKELVQAIKNRDERFDLPIRDTP